ncbi:hypothetical protein LXA43DRAFT_902471 [Ganoderma leucocontextum]|nr:hypothetical protein LXA43DRAFT_902471 [Ganoderma leucocontextum]
MEVLPRASVCEVRSILSSFNIPTELVLHIMDIAEYHPTLRAERSDNVMIEAGWQHDTDLCWAAKLYIVSEPLPRAPEDLFWRVKKVSWELEGRDQGWADERKGEYEGACSWYDACIFRPIRTEGLENAASLADVDRIYRTFRDPKRGMLEVQELLGSAGWSMVTNGDENVWRLQNNRIAQSQVERHVFEWSGDHHGIDSDVRNHGSYDVEGFVEALQPGDRIGIWMRAKQRGWECHTEKASIEIMYEFR